MPGWITIYSLIKPLVAGIPILPSLEDPRSASFTTKTNTINTHHQAHQPCEVRINSTQKFQSKPQIGPGFKCWWIGRENAHVISMGHRWSHYPPLVTGHWKFPASRQHKTGSGTCSALHSPFGSWVLLLPSGAILQISKHIPMNKGKTHSLYRFPQWISQPDNKNKKSPTLQIQAYTVHHEITRSVNLFPSPLPSGNLNIEIHLSRLWSFQFATLVYQKVSPIKSPLKSHEITIPIPIKCK